MARKERDDLFDGICDREALEAMHDVLQVDIRTTVRVSKEKRKISRKGRDGELHDGRPVPRLQELSFESCLEFGHVDFAQTRQSIEEEEQEAVVYGGGESKVLPETARVEGER